MSRSSVQHPAARENGLSPAQKKQLEAAMAKVEEGEQWWTVLFGSRAWSEVAAQLQGPVDDVMHELQLSGCLSNDFRSQVGKLSSYETAKELLNLARRRTDTPFKRAFYVELLVQESKGALSVLAIAEDQAASAAKIASLPLRDANFTGRETELAAYVAAVCRDKPPAIAIRGMGGQGKTSLARELINHGDVAVHCDGRRYWIDCEIIKSASELRQRIAEALEWPEAEKCTNAELLLAASRCEREHLKLLVLDNFETLLAWQAGDHGETNALPIDVLLEQLLDLPKLALVLTMRGESVPVSHSRWQKEKALEGLPPAHARDLFIRLAHPRLDSDAERESLDRLIRALDGHPLSITLLACRLEDGQLTELFDEFEMRRLAFVARESNSSSQELSKMQSLRVCLSLSYQDPRLTEQGRLLLRMLAHLPRPLPLDQLRALTGREDAESDARVLLRLSLSLRGSMSTFTKSRDTLQMHPLVREFVKEQGELSATAWRSAWPAFVDRPWLERHNKLAIFDQNAHSIACLLHSHLVLTSSSVLGRLARGLGLKYASYARQGLLRQRLTRESDALHEYAIAVSPYEAMIAAQRDPMLEVADMLQPVEAAQLSVDLCRLLRVRNHCESDDATLSAALGNLSVRLGEVGRQDEALPIIEEAVELRRKLFAEHPDAYRNDLATSLHNLSNCLSEVGRRDEALKVIEEAVELQRQLFAVHPDADRNDLARSLNNLSNRLGEVGRRDEALPIIEEAVELRRKLFAVHPDAYRSDLAGSLNDLSNRLGEVGRRDEALQIIEEAVELQRQLFAVHPDAYRNDLARSLNNLSNRLSKVGRRDEGLQVIEEAVELRRKLFAEHPDAYRAKLAVSLHNRAVCILALDRLTDALSASREAEYLYSTVYEARPLASATDFAKSLRLLADCLERAEQADEARSKRERAKEIEEAHEKAKATRRWRLGLDADLAGSFE